MACGSLKKNVLTFYPKRLSVLNHITGRKFFSFKQKIFLQVEFMLTIRFNLTHQHNIIKILLDKKR